MVKMMEKNRKRMEDDGSLDDCSDCSDADVMDRFSDEIIRCGNKEIVDVDLADEDPESNGNGDKCVNDNTREASQNDNNINNPSADRRWMCWVGLSIVVAFVVGIVLGNTHHANNRRERNSTSFGNPSLKHSDKRHQPSSQQPPLPDQNENYGSTPGPGNPFFDSYYDPSKSVHNYHQGPPSVGDINYEKRKRNFTNLAVEWSGAAAVATPGSPSRRALDWILDDDPFRLTTADRTLDLKQRYIAAVFYFATLGEHWSSRKLSSRLPRRIRGMQQVSHDDLHNDNNGDGSMTSHNSFNTGSDVSGYFLTNRDVCDWNTSDGRSGIFCDENGIITKLGFRNFGLGGTLPLEIGYLNNLHSIDVEYNDIEGSLPTQYGLLLHLESIKLESNQITGTIPTEIGKLDKLKYLDLDGNYFTGPIPVEIYGLANIIRIEIGGSRLTGSMPAAISNLKQSLQKLDLKNNNISGSIPSELGTLTNLNYLDLENNELTGTVPEELGGAKSLEMLYLNGNDLAGSLDAAFCDTSIAFFEFVADCQGLAPEVKCSCCTSCCNTQGSDCTTSITPLVENTSSQTTVTPTPNPVAQPTAPQGTSVSMEETGSTTPLDSSYPYKLKQVLASISDVSMLEAKHTDQFKAFMWMTRMDPTPLNVDSTPHLIILQKYILILIYISTNGKGWKNQYSYLTDASVCDWEGLTCNDKGELVSIILENNDLEGTLISEIGALGPSLRELQLSMNLLRGQLPSELGLLSGLRTLDVFGNADITGTIPAELSIQSLPNLQKIQLVGTSIKGDLDPLFCTEDKDVDHEGIGVRANCFDPSVTCTCCEVCCDETGNTCRVVENNE